jgi:glycosyltransferase involved in cell wall biosynthesis
MSKNHRLSIVLPAFNEEANIVEAIRRSTVVADRLCADHEVIVVDDGSRDATAEIVRSEAARDPRIRLVRHARNQGYGEALRTGFRSARMDLVFFTDADNQFDLDELEAFLARIDGVDVVAGYRLNRQDPFGRRVNAKAWNLLVRVLFYVPVRDIDCAFKLFRRSVFDEIDIESVGAMVNTELMVKLGRAGAGVLEVGVTHYPRTAGVARGANPRVVARALFELTRMYGRLRTVNEIHAPAPSLTPTRPETNGSRPSSPYAGETINLVDPNSSARATILRARS